MNDKTNVRACVRAVRMYAAAQTSRYNFRDGTLAFCKEDGPETRRVAEERAQAQLQQEIAEGLAADASRPATAAATSSAGGKQKKTKKKNQEKKSLRLRSPSLRSCGGGDGGGGGGGRGDSVSVSTVATARGSTAATSSSSVEARKERGQCFWGTRIKAWDYRKADVFVDTSADAAVVHCGDAEDGDDSANGKPSGASVDVQRMYVRL